mmetsp:Transcript_20014/g.34431  ORF Transcript_20014/g.34431 Transcript_20014/m.34431 type:complete len:345 (+) Transcript_20014:413-1447(+)
MDDLVLGFAPFIVIVAVIIPVPSLSDSDDDDPDSEESDSEELSSEEPSSDMSSGDSSPIPSITFSSFLFIVCIPSISLVLRSCDSTSLNLRAAFSIFSACFDTILMDSSICSNTFPNSFSFFFSFFISLSSWSFLFFLCLSLYVGALIISTSLLLLLAVVIVERFPLLFISALVSLDIEGDVIPLLRSAILNMALNSSCKSSMPSIDMDMETLGAGAYPRSRLLNRNVDDDGDGALVSTAVEVLNRNAEVAAAPAPAAPADVWRGPTNAISRKAEIRAIGLGFKLLLSLTELGGCIIQLAVAVDVDEINASGDDNASIFVCGVCETKGDGDIPWTRSGNRQGRV